MNLYVFGVVKSPHLEKQCLVDPPLVMVHSGVQAGGIISCLVSSCVSVRQCALGKHVAAVDAAAAAAAGLCSCVCISMRVGMCICCCICMCIDMCIGLLSRYACFLFDNKFVH